MKVLTIGALAATLALGACNRSDTTATTAAANGAAASPSAAPASAADAPRSQTDRTAAAGKSAHADEWREVTIPAGTKLPIVLDTAIGSDTSHAEEPVHAHLAKAVVVHGQTALPEGSRISGVVTDATRSGRVKGRAHVAMRFDSVVPRGEDERYTMQTTAVGRTAAATKEKDALKIAAPAAGGALIGRLVGGRKGALVGAGVGGGAGTAYVLSTRGQEVRLGRNASFVLELTEPLTVKVRG